MSTTEDRLRDALHSEVGRQPSPDLFDRVLWSVEHDRARRATMVRLAVVTVLLVAGLVTAVLLFTPRHQAVLGQKGGLAMPWWILELATNLALVAIALWLGPFIKRFGRAYAADVFHDNPLTGKSYIVLTDIVYYLIFAAFILFSVQVAPQEDWADVHPISSVTPGQVTYELSRIGGILLIIGILHGLNIVLMPVLGRLFSLNRRLPTQHDRFGG